MAIQSDFPLRQVQAKAGKFCWYSLCMCGLEIQQAVDNIAYLLASEINSVLCTQWEFWNCCLMMQFVSGANFGKEFCWQGYAI